MVLAPRLVERTTPVMEGILKQFSIEVVPFGIEHAAVAMDAWKRFGRGHHPARLNFGDCISYATARVANEPLLFAGDDFAKTDIVAA
jgi:ribonuclease VapC